MTGSPPPPPPPPGGPIRITISTMRPSVTAVGKKLWGLSTGALWEGLVRNVVKDAKEGRDPESGVNAMTFSPFAEKDTKASYVFDPAGFRLEGYPRLPLAVSWGEVARVVLEVQQFALLGMQGLRVQVWPVDPAAFAARHPRAKPLWDPELGSWSLTLSKAPMVSSTKVDLVQVALRHAGHRYDGRVRYTDSPDS